MAHLIYLKSALLIIKCSQILPQMYRLASMYGIGLKCMYIEANSASNVQIGIGLHIEAACTLRSHAY